MRAYLLWEGLTYKDKIILNLMSLRKPSLWSFSKTHKHWTVWDHLWALRSNSLKCYLLLSIIDASLCNTIHLRANRRSQLNMCCKKNGQIKMIKKRCWLLWTLKQLKKRKSLATLRELTTIPLKLIRYLRFKVLLWKKLIR